MIALPAAAVISAPVVSVRTRPAGPVVTQALIGEPVRVLRLRGRWVRVAIPDQPTHRDRRGFPGWIRRSELARPRWHARRRVRAQARRLDVYGTADKRLALVPFSAVLPIVGGTLLGPEVGLPDGRIGGVDRTEIVDPSWRGDARTVVLFATFFVGAPYVRGGISPRGFDAAGLPYVVYRANGIPIPREAADQRTHGRAVAPHALRRGDLLFYRDGGVAISTDPGRMIEASASDGRVRRTPLRPGFVAARRYLGR